MPVMDLFGHCDTYVELWVSSATEIERCLWGPKTTLAGGTLSHLVPVLLITRLGVKSGSGHRWFTTTQRLNGETFCIHHLLFIQNQQNEQPDLSVVVSLNALYLFGWEIFALANLINWLWSSSCSPLLVSRALRFCNWTHHLERSAEECGKLNTGIACYFLTLEMLATF
jgi:hypothetical protein